MILNAKYIVYLLQYRFSSFMLISNLKIKLIIMRNIGNFEYFWFFNQSKLRYRAYGWILIIFIHSLICPTRKQSLEMLELIIEDRSRDRMCVELLMQSAHRS